MTNPLFFRTTLTAIAAGAGLALAPFAHAQIETTTAGAPQAVASVSDETATVDKAVRVLEAQMKRESSARIPLAVRHAARCVAIFPALTKAGLIVAGQRGQGVVSCRHADTGEWGAPAFYNFTAASVGIQAGIQTSSLMLLIVDQKGVDGLLGEKIKLGSDVSIAVGPVGAGTTVGTGASVLSYSRTEGAFAGVDVGGSAMSFDAKANTATYGPERTAKNILFESLVVPDVVTSFRDTLNSFAPAKS